jgi:hypothetical protein
VRLAPRDVRAAKILHSLTRSAQLTPHREGRLPAHSVHAVDQMKEQRERGQERTILRQVREQDRMVLRFPDAEGTLRQLDPTFPV